MPLKERILVGGVPGVGKTYSWLTIARMLPEHRFYVIDPDDGVRRVWYSEFPDAQNIEYYFTPTWFTKTSTDTPSVNNLEENCYLGGVADAFKTIKPKLKPDDWLVIEMLGNLWSIVQGAFVAEVFQKDVGQYFLEVRKRTKEGATRLDGLRGWTDWTVINRMHNDDFIVPACFETPCHVFMTTSITAGAPTGEDAELKAFYGDSMIRFDGQKHNPFRAQTMLILTAEGKGDKREYFMSTYLKDRGRPHLTKVKLLDFALQYLCEVAEWIS